MKRTKRAFTIVELVIVIAVVAVLAAVLIPTFVSLVNRANESSDIQAVENMNTALMADETANGTPYSASEAILILQEAGLNAQTYNALVSGRAIYYNKSLNRMVYVQLDEYGTIDSIIFPEEYREYNTQDRKDPFWTSFHLLTGRQIADKGWLLNPETQNSKTELDNLKNNTSTDADPATNTSYYEGDKLVGAAVTNYNGILGIAEYIENQEDGAEGFTLVLGSDVYMTDTGTEGGVVQEWKPISNFKGEFRGRGNTIHDLQISDPSADSDYFAAASTYSNYAYYGFISVFTGTYFGNVTIDVNIDEPGNGAPVENGYNKNNHTVGGAIGAIYANAGDEARNVTIENVTVTGKIIGMNRVAGIVGFIGGHSGSPFPGGSTITIKNCTNKAEITTVNASNGTYGTAGGIVSVCNQIGDGVKIIIDNCKNKAAVSGMWAGGIMADAWRSNDSVGKNVFNVAQGQGNSTEKSAVTRVAATNVTNSSKNAITVTNCENSGTITAVAPQVAAGKTSSAVAGGIFGSYHGFYYSSGAKNSSNNIAMVGTKYTSNGVQYTRTADHFADDVYSQRFALKIESCTNSGEIKYEVADGFHGNIHLDEIVPTSYTLSQRGYIGVEWKKDTVKEIDETDFATKYGLAYALLGLTLGTDANAKKPGEGKMITVTGAEEKSLSVLGSSGIKYYDLVTGSNDVANDYVRIFVG